MRTIFAQGVSLRRLLGWCHTYGLGLPRSYYPQLAKLFAGFLVLAVLLFAQPPAPPYIDQGGIVNAASRMPPTLPGGAIARGALFTISGLRLSLPQKQDFTAVTITVTKGEASVRASIRYLSETRILAQMPLDAPLGPAKLMLRYGTQTSAPFSLNVVARSPGIFDAHFLRDAFELPPGLREIPKLHATRGETIAILGSGSGGISSGVHVLVGGVEGSHVRVERGELEGVDRIVVEIPKNAPLGCNVPLSLRAGGITSNTVAVAIATAGQACPPGPDWLAEMLAAGPRKGVFVFSRLQIQVQFPGRVRSDSQWDWAFAAFSGTLQSADIVQLPSAGHCLSYTGVEEAGLFARMQSPAAIDNKVSGLAQPLVEPVAVSMAAGPEILIEGAAGQRKVPLVETAPVHYTAVIGGVMPVRQPGPLPMFLEPGPFRIQVPGGSSIPAFAASLVMPKAIVLKEPQRLRATYGGGVPVAWTPVDGAAYMVAAAASDPLTGAAAAAVCSPRAGQTSFVVPAEAMANFPHGSGEAPYFAVVVASFPAKRPTSQRAAGLDSVTVIPTSVSGRVLLH
jgi:uncharacterized protein (TIGR03437 family)